MTDKRESSRDPGFIARHRGGHLTPENHRALNRWARECAERLSSLLEGDLDPRLTHALKISLDWENGQVKTGVCMAASREAHAAARDAVTSLETYIARAIGHAVATAHMADHSLGPMIYGMKATEMSGRSVELELDWQSRRLKELAPDLMDLTLKTFYRKTGIYLE